MKQLFAFLFFVLALPGFAQVIKAGTVNYSISIESGMEDNAFVQEMMKDAEMTVTFNAKNSSVKTTMGLFMTSSTIVQVKKKKAVMLTDAMGSQYGVNLTLSELKKQNTATSSFVETDETKEILGYLCKKGTFTAEGGTTGEVWYTTGIKANMTGQQFFSITNKGFILEEISVTEGVTLKVTATAISTEPVNTEVFSLTIPEGYQVMTPKEFEDMQNGN